LQESAACDCVVDVREGDRVLYPILGATLPAGLVQGPCSYEEAAVGRRSSRICINSSRTAVPEEGYDESSFGCREVLYCGPEG
jgi:hypothetical protein